MLLFRPEHVSMILEGRKTQTRRLWPKGCRARVGSQHQARTRMLESKSCFAHLGILRVWKEPLGSISENDARAEGYESRDKYLEAFGRINGHVPSMVVVWCVEFRVVGAP